MIRLKSFQIKNCFGFGDSGEVKLDNAHNMIYLLGRNSSGKTSLLNGIKHFESNLKPDDYPNFENFRPTQEPPLLTAKFSVEGDDLSAPDVRAEIQKRFRKTVSQSIVQRDQRITGLLDEAESLYQQLITAAVQRGHIWVERAGNGVYRFLTSLETDEDYQSRRSTLTKLRNDLFDSQGRYVGFAPFARTVCL